MAKKKPQAKKAKQKNSPAPIPCSVIIRKEGKEERKCPEDATVLFNVVDPDDHSVVVSSLPLCERHAAKLDNGKTVVIKEGDTYSMLNTGTNVA